MAVATIATPGPAPAPAPRTTPTPPAGTPATLPPAAPTSAVISPPEIMNPVPTPVPPAAAMYFVARRGRTLSTSRRLTPRMSVMPSTGWSRSRNASAILSELSEVSAIEEEIVPPAFRTLEEASRSLKLLDGTIGSLEIRRERMRELATRSFGTATELAAEIHRQTDLSARTAHRIVGNFALRAFKRGLRADQVDAALLDESAQAIVGHKLGLNGAEIRRMLDPEAFVAAHDISGGPAPQALRAAIASSRERLAQCLRAEVGEGPQADLEASQELEEVSVRRRTTVA